jgi:hypothetical protein
MREPVTLTLAEVASILDPPMAEWQLRLIAVRALGWRPDGYRHNGRPGHPTATFDAAELMALHAALLPFNRR